MTDERADASIDSDPAFCRPQVVVDLPPSPDGASFRRWQGHLGFAGSADLVDPDAAPAFQAAVEIYFLDNLIISLSSGSHAHRIVRTPQDVARTGIDFLLVSLHLEGGHDGRCGRRPIQAGPGDVSFVDYAFPFDVVVPPFRTLALTVPRTALPEPMRRRALHGLVPDAGHPATRLLVHCLREIHAALPSLTCEQGIAAARALVGLADAASQGSRDVRDDVSPAKLDLFDQAQARIERSLGDGDLSVAALAGNLGVSRAVLYGLFSEHGGVQSYIRERRLHRCYEILNGGDRTDETIGAIALSMGFRSEAHFSRAFKERFGLSPRELRIIAARRGVDMLPPQAAGIPSDRLQTLGR